jgi:hypothetical protein
MQTPNCGGSSMIWNSVHRTSNRTRVLAIMLAEVATQLPATKNETTESLPNQVVSEAIPETILLKLHCRELLLRSRSLIERAQTRLKTVFSCDTLPATCVNAVKLSASSLCPILISVEESFQLRLVESGETDPPQLSCCYKQRGLRIVHGARRNRNIAVTPVSEKDIFSYGSMTIVHSLEESVVMMRNCGRRVALEDAVFSRNNWSGGGLR